MFPKMIVGMTLSVLCMFLFSQTFAQDRKISSELNPGCQQCSFSNTTLVYIRAEGSHDIIHQIWDFTGGVPTVILSVGTLNSSLDIAWDKDVPRHFNLSEPPMYSFSMLVDKLVEYDDLEDVGEMKTKDPQKEHSLQGLTWNLTDSIFTEKEVMVELKSHWRHHGKPAKGYVTAKLDLLPYKDYAVDLPHLIHNANSTLMDLRMVNLTTSPEYNASRFAWHLTLVSTDPANGSMHCYMRKSLDDEHTPGVFEIIEIKTPSSVRSSLGGFAQFRPVAYSAAQREVTSSTIAHVSDFNSSSIPAKSTASRFYSDAGRADLLVEGIFVSFGEPGDGSYRKHNYTDWSLTIGYGSPPMEGVSLFVILVISIGLGVPVVLALSGIIYVVSRRVRQRNAHVRFNDE